MYQVYQENWLLYRKGYDIILCVLWVIFLTARCAKKTQRTQGSFLPSLWYTATRHHCPFFRPLSLRERARVRALRSHAPPSPSPKGRGDGVSAIQKRSICDVVQYTSTLTPQTNSGNAGLGKVRLLSSACLPIIFRRAYPLKSRRFPPENSSPADA